jgi:hypothetical protein
MATYEPSAALPLNVFTLLRTSQLEALYTIIRDQNTSRCVICNIGVLLYLDLFGQWRFHLLLGPYHKASCGGRFALLPFQVFRCRRCDVCRSQSFTCTPENRTNPYRWAMFRIPNVLISCPLGASYDGVGFEGRICGVSILRAGEVCIHLLIVERNSSPIILPNTGHGSWSS